jgi:hypothetical protein
MQPRALLVSVQKDPKAWAWEVEQWQPTGTSAATSGHVDAQLAGRVVRPREGSPRPGGGCAPSDTYLLPNRGQMTYYSAFQTGPSISYWAPHREGLGVVERQPLACGRLC